MQTLIKFFTAVLFLVWVLPLGVFIAPQQEELACNGQRAICLCSRGMSEPVTQPPRHDMFQGQTGSERNEQTAPAGAGHSFIVIPHLRLAQQTSNGFLRSMPQHYSLDIIRSIEHVPKV